MTSLPSLVRLARPGNAVIAMAATLSGALCLEHFQPAQVLWSAATMGFLVLAGNLHNDVLDVETDRLSHPNRPLVTGEVPPVLAALLAAALAGCAMVSAWLVSLAHFALAGGMATVLVVYNTRLKSMALWGNLAVAALCALAVYFPEFPYPPERTGPAAGFAFLATLAREILKDLEDAAGDAASGRRTLPLVTSRGRAAWLSSGVLFLMVFGLPVSVILGVLPWSFLFYSLGLVLLPSAWSWRAISLGNWKSAQTGVKFAMIGGIASILAALRWG